MANSLKRYLALMPKEEISNLFLHGSCHPYFPVIEISDSIEEDEVNKLLSLANPFDYAFEKFLVTFTTSTILAKGKNVATSASVFSTEVVDIFALTEEARRIGISGIDYEIKPSPCESSFKSYLLEQQVNEAFIGVREILSMMNVKFKDGKKGPALFRTSGFVTAEDVKTALLIGEDILAHSKDESIWSYLLTYTRHQPYPDGIFGYALDAIHIAFSHAQGCEIDADMMKSNLWKGSISNQEPALFDSSESEILKLLASVIEKDKGFKAKIGKQSKDFFSIAMTFLAIKEELQKGAEHVKSVYGSLSQLLAISEDRLMPGSIESFNKVLYLVGVTLGHRGVSDLG